VPNPITPQQLYEGTLVIRSQIGDESAFRELLELHSPHLRLFTRRMLNKFPEQIEDVTQDIWVAIFRGLPTLHDVSKFRSWAFRLARDRIYREYRRRGLPEWNQDQLEVEAVPDSDDFQMAADFEELHLCLGSLSPEHREALVLRFFENMSHPWKGRNGRAPGIAEPGTQRDEDRRINEAEGHRPKVVATTPASSRRRRDHISAPVGVQALPCIGQRGKIPWFQSASSGRQFGSELGQPPEGAWHYSEPVCRWAGH
jgi:RNA polymerase sigma-70 factor, ECF subfamily